MLLADHFVSEPHIFECTTPHDAFPFSRCKIFIRKANEKEHSFFQALVLVRIVFMTTLALIYRENPVVEVSDGNDVRNEFSM